MVRTVAPDGFTDISLDAWIDFTAKDLIARGTMSVEFFCDKFGEIMAAPRQLGGILLFDGATLTGSRVNYNANDACRVNHRQMSKIEDVFGSGASWWV
jgi:hypothetical protein